MENDLPRSNNALEGFHDTSRSSIASFHPNQWRSFKVLKQELEFPAMKKTQLLRGDLSYKKKPYQIADSKVKRHLNIVDDNGDVERLRTSLANVIKC